MSPSGRASPLTPPFVPWSTRPSCGYPAPSRPLASLRARGPEPRAPRLRRRLGEVVDSLAADGLLREVGRDPLRDGRRALPAAEALAVGAHVVMDLVLGHEFFEPGQRGPGGGPVKPADGHHRVTGG